MAVPNATSGSSNLLATSALLTTKLFVPQVRLLQDILPRPRLADRLTSGLARKLTLVSAPAGYGKTMLVADWVAQCQCPIAWLSLDEADNDSARFLTYLIAAIQTLQADFGLTLRVMLQSPQPPVLEHLVTALVNEIAHTLDRFALVLDDYHLIQEPAIHSAITFILNHCPPNLHLILLSRADPPLPLARLRVRGELTEVRTADLRFTLDEVSQFFHHLKQLPLVDEQVQELAARTEGWGAGLHLASLSLHGLDQAGIARFIDDFTGSHYNVFDYLVEEALHQQPAEIYQFLLHTSVLNRLCGPLCDALLGQGAVSGQAVLEKLQQANIFVIPLDNERRWYRYHHLFAEMLFNRLQQTQPEWVPELYRRASQWYNEAQLVDEAVNFALAGRDFAEAARLIETITGDVLRRGSSVSLTHWLDALPETIIYARPQSCLARAWTLQMGQATDLDSAEEWVKRALQSATGQGAGDPDLTGQVAALQAMIAASRGEMVRSRGLAIQAQRELLPDNSLHGAVSFCIGTAHLVSGGTLAAAQAFAEAVKRSQADGIHFIQLAAASFLADIEVLQGYLDRAMTLYQQVLDWSVPTIPQKGRIMAYAGQAAILYERNELEAALVQAQMGAEQAGEVGGAWSAFVIDRILARVYQARGDWLTADAMLERAYQIGQRVKVSPVVTQAAALRAGLQLAQGNLAEATAWAANCGLNPAAQELSHPGMREVEYLILARVLTRQGRFDAALALLELLAQAAQLEGRNGSLIAISVLQALVRQAQGEQAAALLFLQQALTLAEPEGYIRTFVDEGAPMAALLRAAQTHAIRPAYAAKLLATFPTAETPETTSPPAARVQSAPPIPNPVQPMEVKTPSLIEPLSTRELEILRLVAEGYTNPEIGQQIYISDQTVKVHTRNIYGKLGVNGRREAVAKARALGLLG